MADAMGSLEVSSSESPMVVSLWDLVRTFSASWLQLLQEITSYAARPIDPNSLVGKSDLRHFREPFEKGHLELSQVGLHATALRLARLTELARSEGPVTHGQFRTVIHDLQRTFRDEVDSMLFWAIDGTDLDCLQPEPFGARVNDAFPEATHDIEESGICLALGRGTAAVFHLMRVVERGLRELGKDLGISRPSTWERYIDQLTKRITSSRSDDHFFGRLRDDIQAIRGAWRHPMVDVHRDYSIEEAHQVYDAVKVWMQHLVERYGESASRGEG